MCTVAFIPKGNQFYFASLRDEHPARTPALAPQLHSVDDGFFLAPTDGKAGGTWIGISVWGNVIILLNGAFKNHERQQTYRQSRGLIVAQLLSAALPIQQWQLMSLENIEPFTLVVFTNNNLFQLVWDGSVKHCKCLAADQPYLWSSSTLYSPAAKLYRKHLFDSWMTTNAPVTAATLLGFFNSSSDKENGFIINRNNKMQTLSYSFISLKKHSNASIEYVNLLNNTQHSKVINLKMNAAETA